MRVKGIAVLICLLAASALLAAGDYFVESMKQQGEAVSDPAELYFTGYHDTPWFQSIFYQVSGDCGTDFFTHLFFTDLGFGIRRFGLDFKLRYPDGRVRYFGRQMSSSEGELERGAFSIRLGPNRASGDLEKHVLHIEEDGLVADFEFKALAPFYRPADGARVYLDRDREDWASIIYFTCFEVQGTIKDGGTVTRVSGWGYGDLLRGNILVTDFARFCSGIRFYKDGLGFDYVDYAVTPEYGGSLVPVLIVHKDGKIIHASAGCRKTVLASFQDPETGQFIPADVLIESEGEGVKARIEFTGVEVTDYNDPLITFSPWGRRLIALFADAPLDLRMDGDVKIEVETDDGLETREGRTYALVLSDR